MELDSVYGYLNPAFSSVYDYTDPFQYLIHLNFETYTPQLQKMLIDESKIDELVNSKYAKMKAKEIPQVGAGMPSKPKFMFRR